MQNSRSVATLTLTAAVLAAAMAAPVSHASTPGDTVHCAGVNSCKGKGDCKTAENACKGQNSCKGHGFVAMPAAQCAAIGGVVVK